MRIAIRRDKGREATAEEVAIAVANRRDKYLGDVSAPEIVRAFERGNEVSLVRPRRIRSSSLRVARYTAEDAVLGNEVCRIRRGLPG